MVSSINSPIKEDVGILNKKNPGVLPRPIKGQGRQLVQITREIGKGIIVLFIIVAVVTFISWNFFKLEQVANVTNEILSAPPAVNLTVSKGKTTLYRRSFPFNRKGTDYIVNQFDITPYLSGEPIRLTVNDRAPDTPRVFRFTRFNILYPGDYCFVFTTPECEIEDLVRLRNTAPFIPGALWKLALDTGTETGQKILIHRLFENSGKILKYHGGRFSITLPPGLKKGEICEVVFRYKVTGKAWPLVLLTEGPPHDEKISFHRFLETGAAGESRQVSVLVRAPTDTAPPVFHIAVRYPWTRPPYTGTVHIKHVAVYRYAYERTLPRTSIAYLDITGKLKNEFIELL